MLVLGLTGGVGAGKTTVGKLLAARGAKLVSLDRIASNLLQVGSPVFADIAALCPQVIKDDKLDRAALASLIFSDPEMLKQVNAIVHPRAWEISDEEVKAAEGEGWDVVVVESALLLGSIRERSYDANIVVIADDESRIARLVDHRRMSREDAAARIRAQASLQDFITMADYTVENSGSQEQLAQEVARMWTEWITPLAERIQAEGSLWVERARLGA